MADRTINININITGNTGAGGGGTNTGGGGGLAANTERAKQKQMEADFRAHEQELLNIKKAADKQMVAEERAFQKEQANQQRTAAKQKVADEKAASKQILDQERATNKQRQAELRKAIAEQKNTWGGAISSYQFKFNALGNIISNVVSQATQTLYQLGSSVVTISKDFEFAMSGVKAITMATDAEFKALRADAVRLGGDTIYTATQVAGLQTELAKLGFTVKEIRSATDAIVALAAATGEDLAQSALVAGTIVRGFNLDASDLTGVVDIMSASFNSSALDLYKFTETMKYVAPVASKTGFAMAEVTAIMAKLADQGVVASQAGTSLRNLMLRLADANSKLSKAIGFTVTNLPQLVVGFRKLSDAGLDATKALSLADRYSVTALLGLAQQSEGMWKLYRSMIAVRDTAQKTADIRMDNFAGSVEKAKGAWDSLVLTINKGNGVLREFVDLGTSTLEFLSEWLGSYAGKVDSAANALMMGFKNMTKNTLLDTENLYADQQEALMKLMDAGLISEKDWLTASNELTRMYSEDKVTIQKDGLQRVIDAETATIERIGEGKNQSQKKFIDSHKEYLNALLQLQKDNQNKEVKNLVDTLADQVEELEKSTKSRRQFLIDAMLEGLQKELEIINFHYDTLQSEAEKAGFTDIDFTRAREEAKIKIIKEFNEKQKKLLEDRNKQFDIEYLSKKGLGDVKALTKDKLGYLGVPTDEYQRTSSGSLMRPGMSLSDLLAPGLNQGLVGLPTTSGSETDFNIWDKLGIGDLTSEQKQSLEKGFNFVTDQLQKIADKEVEIADRRVESSQRVVDQLQQDLQTEVALAEAGFASNVTLKQRELEEAKKQQASALLLQEEAVKKKQQMESLLQAVDLISATANIISSTTEMGPFGIALAIAEIATMWGVFGAAQTKAKELTKMGDGGEINGPKHSAGGTMIEAEGGEFMVKASAYDNHKDLVQAINNEDMASVYRSLNQDLSVSLDDSNTARMLGRHFKNKKEVTYFNGGRVEIIGNRRRTIRNA